MRVFQRQGCWAQVPIAELKGVISCVAEIFRVTRFPIVVQTFWEGNESHERLVEMGSGRIWSFIRKVVGIDIRSPKDAAFLLSIWRSRNYIVEEFPDTKWEVFADAGSKDQVEQWSYPLVGVIPSLFECTLKTPRSVASFS